MNTKKPEERSEYTFRGGVRGKHHRAYREGTNLRVLDVDMARQFPDSASVNRALRRSIGKDAKPSP
ncbi:MAG: hypothetical protein WEE67_00930 [Chloroflexota bacterium]